MYMTVQDLPELARVRDVARVLEVSEQTVRRMCRDGKVQAVMVGREWRVNSRALAESLGLKEVA